MFTIKDLHNEMRDGMTNGSNCMFSAGKYDLSGSNCMFSAGKYDLSIGFSPYHYCSPKATVDPSLYSAVEIALFKNGDWVLPDEMETIKGFLWTNLFEPAAGSNTSIAPYVTMSTVCDIVNFLRNMEVAVSTAVSSSTVETPFKKEEVSCCVCGRQNDVGVSMCWFCGNSPT